MSMNKNFWISIGILVVVVVAGYFLLAHKPRMASEEPIKIGGMFALTGYASFAGEASRDGFLMAIEDSGMNVEPVVEDFKSDTKVAVTVAQKLTSVDHVPAVIGPEWAEFGEVVTPIANSTKTVFISPWMVSESKLAPPYYFSATPSDRLEKSALVKYMAAHGYKHIVLVYSNNAWSLASVKTFKQELAKYGGVDIIAEYKFQPDQLDYRTDIARIKALQPDAVYSLVATDDSQGNFSKELTEAGLKIPQFFDPSRAESPDLLKSYLPYAIGAMYPAPAEYKNEATFDAKYEKRFGHAPAALSAATAYDMTTLVLKAIKSGAVTSDQIREYLTEVKNYDGYSDNITFNSQGQVENQTIVMKKVTQNGPEVISN